MIFDLDLFNLKNQAQLSSRFLFKGQKPVVVTLLCFFFVKYDVSEQQTFHNFSNSRRPITAIGCPGWPLGSG